MSDTAPAERRKDHWKRRMVDAAKREYELARAENHFTESGQIMITLNISQGGLAGNAEFLEKLILR